MSAPPTRPGFSKVGRSTRSSAAYAAATGADASRRARQEGAGRAQPREESGFNVPLLSQAAGRNTARVCHPAVVEEPIVLVDARNVVLSRWPNLSEEQSVESARAWAAAEGVRAVLVFDGRAPGGDEGVREPDGRTCVVGTGSGSADDWIAAEAERLGREGRRLWLVSSDRGLRQRVAPYAERTIGGGTFASVLEGWGATA